MRDIRGGCEMRLKVIAGVLIGALAFGAGALGQVPAETRPQVAAKASPPPLPATPSTTPPLTKQDLDGWLDGFMPYALASGDVAGAVVVVVKDGQILSQKGYGYADVKSGRKVDPARTLFRPGSVSKLFVWTAVMQQVEQGKIDLNADINRYLDFKIPPYQGKPITMRDLMTHTPGFEEWGKSLFVASPERLIPLEPLLKRWTPKRIFAPGTTPAYSNYGASLAGYIVQRLSGEKFDDYMDRHIFAPLDMKTSTFRQPLPRQFEAEMSSSYQQASMPAKPYELVAGEPAGSVSATGEDMAHFMIAHLQDGRYGANRILKPETARLMRVEQPKINPPLNYMALGFYHEDWNGHTVLGHGGDTSWFHSELHILPDDNVGLYVSMNSLGKNAAVAPIRQALFRNFMDRYYPAPRQALPTAGTAQAHAKQVEGLYWWSRRSSSNLMSALNLMQAKVTANPDGTIQVSMLHDASGAAKRWREVGPYVWKDENDASTLAGAVRDGRVVSLATDDLPPVMVLQPVPGWASAAWNLPLLYFTLGVMALTVALWPVQALVRRRYGHSFALQGREALAYRLTKAAVLVQLVTLIAWPMLLMRLGNENPDGSLDWVQRVIQILCLLGVLGTLAAAWNAVLAWTSGARDWLARASASVVALACVAFVWFVTAFHLLSFSLLF